MSSTKNLFINGEWLAGAGVAMESIDPAKKSSCLARPSGHC